MKKKKNEDFYEMEERVNEELDAILDKYGKITSLTSDQKAVLIRTNISIKEKFISVYSEDYCYDTDYGTVPHHDEPILMMNKYINLLTEAAQEANAFIIKNKLVNVNVGIDNEEIIVGGYPDVPESKLIAEYSKEYLAVKKEEARQLELDRKADEREAKARRKSATKTICVDGKKYKLIDEDDCEDC